MRPDIFIIFLNFIEKTKCNTRHSQTSSGRRESVVEHSWRLSVMALLCADEFPELDTNKVVKMCLIRDFGEAVIGDIPAFSKTSEKESEERTAVQELLSYLLHDTSAELNALFNEMDALETNEAILYKALDNLNEADILRWSPNEYEFNLTYGTENCSKLPWTKAVREAVKRESLLKVAKSYAGKTVEITIDRPI